MVWACSYQSCSRNDMSGIEVSQKQILMNHSATREGTRNSLWQSLHGKVVGRKTYPNNNSTHPNRTLSTNNKARQYLLLSSNSSSSDMTRPLASGTTLNNTHHHRPQPSNLFLLKAQRINSSGQQISPTLTFQLLANFQPPKSKVTANPSRGVWARKQSHQTKSTMTPWTLMSPTFT